MRILVVYRLRGLTLIRFARLVGRTIRSGLQVGVQPGESIVIPFRHEFDLVLVGPVVLVPPGLWPALLVVLGSGAERGVSVPRDLRGRGEHVPLGVPLSVRRV